MHPRPSSLHWSVIPLLMGMVLGISLSSVVLLQPYRITNIYIGFQENADGYHREMEQKLQDFQKLMDELHPGYLDSTKKSLLSEELVMKVPVQYAVVINKGASTDQLDAVKKTWARDVKASRLHYYYNSSEEPQALEVLKNSSHTATKLSSSEAIEVQVLRHICRMRLNTTKWFYIGYSNGYVKVKELESYLLSLEAVEDQVLYLGRPVKRDKIGRICLPGPGSILAYSVLSQVCPKLDSCRENHDTEFVLGECIHKTLPEIQCRKDPLFQGLFLNFDAEKKGSIMDVSNKERLVQAFTVFPVTDPAHVYGIHRYVYDMRLNESLYLLQELKQVEGHMLGLLPQSQSVRNNDSHWKKDSWQLINQNLLMSTENSNPALPLQQFWKEEIKILTETTMEYLYSKEESSFIFSRTGNIYFKLSPFTGMEYIFDFEAKAPNEGKKRANIKHFQVTLSRPLGSLEKSPPMPLGESKRITIFIVAAIKHANLLSNFMKGLENVLKTDQRIDLVIVRMKAKGDKSDKVVVLHRIVHSYEAHYLQASFRIIDTSLPLSRARAIGKVLRELRPGDILFLADLSFVFTPSFLERCRNIPVQGQQLFFPIPFSLFHARQQFSNSTLNKSEEKQPKNQSEAFSISAKAGHWLLGSHSACCVHVADLLSAVQRPGKKGIPKEIEIEELYNGVVEKRYEVIKGPDSGLVQEYMEDRTCPLDVIGEAQASCHGLPDLEQNIKRNGLSELLFDEKGHAYNF